MRALLRRLTGKSAHEGAEKSPDAALQPTTIQPNNK